jgi:acetyl-CoA carboxylase biotin carboxyl carrier protein
VSDELEATEAATDATDAADVPETTDMPDPPTTDATSIVPLADTGDASLLALIDRLGAMLERSDLTELEVEVGGTALVLRKPAAFAQPVAPGGGVAVAPAPAATGQTSDTPAPESAAAPSRPSIKAPLTGLWYGSPAPGSAPFVEVGREVAVGQVVGLIEAMKLFNEIKSDLAGRVVRVVPESGALVKAKQPLIEVDPL